MSSAGNSTSGSSSRSSVGTTSAQSTPLPPTPTPTPTPAQPTPTPVPTPSTTRSNTPSPSPVPSLSTQQQAPPSTTSHSKPPSSTGWSNVPLEPGDHHGGRDQDLNDSSRTMQIVIPIFSTIAAVIFLVGAYRLALYLRHRRQQKTSAPLPPPRTPHMLARQSVMVDYDMVPPLISASTSGHASLQGSSRTVSSIGGRSPLLVNDQPITAGATPFPVSSASSSSVPSEEYDYTKPIPRRPRPVSLVNSVASRHSVFTATSNRHSVHATPHRTSLRGAPHHSRIDIVLPEPLGPTTGLNQTTFYPPRMPRASYVPPPPAFGDQWNRDMGLHPMRQHPSTSRTSTRLRSYTPEDFDNESTTAPSSSHHHTQDHILPPIPPLPPTLPLSPFLTPDTPTFSTSALTLPPSSPPNTTAALLPVTTTTIQSASNETPNASSLPSPAETSSPTTLTTTER